MNEEQVRRIKERHSADLRSRAGVSGVGVQKDPQGKFYISVLVDPSVPGVAEGLPQELEGAPVRAERSGPFKAL
jgi:hypothetical protein